MSKETTVQVVQVVRENMYVEDEKLWELRIILSP